MTIIGKYSSDLRKRRHPFSVLDWQSGVIPASWSEELSEPVLVDMVEVPACEACSTPHQESKDHTSGHCKYQVMRIAAKQRHFKRECHTQQFFPVLLSACVLGWFQLQE
ncbi:uncharacterized protein LOC126195810 isoform X2 [Schistocerca nitens]|uniref:uncharacterized protein LOC126195810 isoform X2 n=1 Tax=Schistocerca nitens TaxID=7011 RepID=UPI0021193A68|nr:uncharacterized protein LOC126195810 isoform X2 [Schistocerca nitens]